MRIFVSAAKLFAQNAPARRYYVLAPVLQPPSQRISSPSLAQDDCTKEAWLKMMNFVRQILAAMIMTAVVSTGVLAQGKGQDKRPKKETVRVIEGKGGGGNKPPQPKPPKQDDRGKKRP